jgi:hypothetical protein
LPQIDMTTINPPERTLFDQLTHFKRAYAATDHIKFLFKAVAHDVCTAQHNAWTFLKLLETIRDTCANIDEHIKRVDSYEDPSNQNIWIDFDTYTRAIGPLEQSVISGTLDLLFVDSNFQVH